MKQKRVLIIYYSYSGQTRKVIIAFAGGLKSKGILVTIQQLRPKGKLPFPLGSIGATFKLMIETFFRRRMAIEEPEEALRDDWSLIVLGGPTWSYNPSGPVLSFLDDYGSHLQGKRVLPCISCRGYWRTHFFQLRHILGKHHAETLDPVVFTHSGREPWRTVGVFLKIAGWMPESGKSWISRYYPRYGHSRKQLDRARGLGERYGERLKESASLEDLGPFLVRHSDGPAQN